MEWTTTVVHDNGKNLCYFIYEAAKNYLMSYEAVYINPLMLQ